MYLKFKEELPDGCPLAESKDVALSDVWRFIKGRSVTDECFRSKAALGKQRPAEVNECDWASCSLVSGSHKAEALHKLQFRKRFKGRVELNIPQGMGRSFFKGHHVDFWAYDTFDFQAAVVKVCYND